MPARTGHRPQRAARARGLDACGDLGDLLVGDLAKRVRRLILRAASAFSAEEPERLRGPQHDLAYCDELATWKHPEALDMLNLGLRVGIRPRKLITTTPRPSKMLKAIIADPTTVITRGKTVDNAQNLAPTFISSIMSRYSGTRLGRQEIDGELLTDVQGALWKVRRCRAASQSRSPLLPRLQLRPYRFAGHRLSAVHSLEKGSFQCPHALGKDGATLL
jgi:hypothetical protein